jgi:phospholipid/cholesterol/gamma-HCH transport system ATP-binding protein
MTKPPIIEFKNVTKRFDERTILDRINLQIYEGDVTTIIGKSGEGKSVLLKHIIGLLRPDEGSVLFRGRPIEQLSKSQVREKVMARLEQTELTNVVDKYPSELSGGMQKRMALARALVTDPKIVLFDELTTGQDPIRRNAILGMIAEYNPTEFWPFTIKKLFFRAHLKPSKNLITPFTMKSSPVSKICSMS